MPTGTNTLFFIHPSKIPRYKKVTYVRLVASLQLRKVEKRHVRVTIGGDRLEYNGKTATVPATLITIKIHLNSTILTANARYMTLDIKDYYYGTLMDDYEYAQILLALIPSKIIAQYRLHSIAVNGKVYCEVCKGMPGLKQTGIIAHARLAKHLIVYGYIQALHTPSL